MRDPIDAYDIRKVIEKKYPQPAYLTLNELRSTTGFATRERYADVVVFSMWPSNGLTVTGMEIKVSRSDLLHEMKTPEKSHAIKKYCDYWYLCVPLYMKLDEIEIPPEWGIMQFSKQKVVKVKRKAPKLNSEPMSKGFLFSCMRAANRKGLDQVEQFIRGIR